MHSFAPMSETTTLAGTRAERMAEAWFLEMNLGARVLDRNFRIRAGEIDLIFEVPGVRGLELVFVEVRSRSPEGWVSGVESVTWPKQRRIERAIEAWLAKRTRAGSRRWRSLRIDVLGWDGHEWTHVPNAWTR